MYPASSSVPHTQLRRAKSAPSVQKRRQNPPRMSPPDPGTAKSHALAAASHAMLNARAQSSHESSRSSGNPLQVEERVVTKVSSQPGRQPIWSFAGDEHALSQISTAGAPSLRTRSRKGISDGWSDYAGLSPIQEFGGLNVEDTGAPSSYRRIRNARSMLLTRHRMGSMSLRTSASAGANDSMNRQFVSEKPNTGSLRKSIFIGIHRPHLRRSNSQSAAVQLAREQYLGDQDCNRRNFRPGLSRQSSSLEHRPFRKTFRSSSETDPAALHPSPDFHHQGSSFHTRARAFSVHVKSRLKRVFGLKRSSDEETDVRRCKPAEISLTVSSNSERDRRVEQYLKNQESGYRSRAPSIRTIRSFDSMATSASRVTSWADSTTTNTAATKHPSESNHLTVIQEHGDPDQPRPIYQDQSAERPDYASKETSSKNSNRAPEPVDVRRVYSALMRKIEREAQGERDRTISLGNVESHIAVHEPISGACSLSSRCSIRRVPSDISIRTIRTSLVPQRQQSLRESLSSPSTVAPEDMSQIDTPKTVRGGENLSPRLSRRPIQQAESSFFPTTTVLKPKTPSPYRLALNAMREKQHQPKEDRRMDDVSACLNDEDQPDSPSIYSRATEANLWSRENLPPLVNVYERNKGMVTIFDTQKGLYGSPAGDATKSKVVNSVKSQDTKVWVDQKMTDFDKDPSPRSCPVPVEIEGHHQEIVQIFGGERGTVPNGGGVGAHSFSRISSRQERSPLSELSVSKQSNFSRPLSRKMSSSTTIQNNQSPMLHVSSYSYQPRLCEFSALHHDEQATHKLCSAPVSPSRNTVYDPATTESPSFRRSLRAWRQSRLSRAAAPAQLSGRIENATDAQPTLFDPVQEIQYVEHPNSSHGQATNGRESRSPASLLHRDKLHDFHSTISSKRMVDIFLSSRNIQRKSPEGSDLGSVFL